MTQTTPAWGICDPDNPSYDFPFKCSLVCCGSGSQHGGIGWPMHSGTLQLMLYSEDCLGNTGRASMFYAPGTFQTPLSCPQSARNSGEFSCTWTGISSHTTNQAVIGDVQYGYNIRIRATMTAVSFNQVSASFVLERLAAGEDFTPPQTDNQWITCATGSTTCYRVVGSGTDPNDRQIPMHFIS